MKINIMLWIYKDDVLLLIVNNFIFFINLNMNIWLMDFSKFNYSNKEKNKLEKTFFILKHNKKLRVIKTKYNFINWIFN